LINQNDAWRVSAAGMEVDLVYRLNIAAFAGINLDIGVWRELL